MVGKHINRNWNDDNRHTDLQYRKDQADERPQSRRRNADHRETDAGQDRLDDGDPNDTHRYAPHRILRE